MLKGTTRCAIFLTIILGFFLFGFTARDEGRQAAVLGGDSQATITLKYNDYSITYKDEKIKPTNHRVAEEIFSRKINSDFCQKMNAVDICIYAGADYKTALLYSFPLLEKTVDRAIASIDTAPEDSVVSFFPNKKDMFVISKERCGYKADENAIYQSIYFALRRQSSVKISVVPKVLEPKVTREDNEKLTHLRARFSTYYGASGEGRKHNIELALKKINGTVIKGGEEFSFNKVVGKRTEMGGFRKAIIINQGEYVEGTGGGVCQASTTVYNCALLADMKILSARSHSLEPSYVWPSFDAMVSSATDLKFQNFGASPVFIKAFGDGENAVVEIYGSRLPYKILRRSEEISREDPPEDKIMVDTTYKYFKKEEAIASGTQKRIYRGKGELKSTGFLLYYDMNGNFLEKKQIRKDTYGRTSGLIAVAP